MLWLDIPQFINSQFQRAFLKVWNPPLKPHDINPGTYEITVCVETIDEMVFFHVQELRGSGDDWPPNGSFPPLN